MILDSLFSTALRLPPLGLNEIHIWAAHPDQLPLRDDDLRFLTLEERHQHDRYYFEKDKWTFMAGRILSKGLIRHYLKRRFEGNFELLEYGKPYLPAGSLHFNISHSGGCVVVAFSRTQPVGVDIEYCDPKVRHDQLADRFFCQSEQQYLRSQDDAEKEFYRIWTRKEAFIKADGRGVHLSLDGFSVVGFECENSKWARVDTANLKGFDSGWFLQDFNFNRDIMGAVCTSQREQLRFYRFDSETFELIRGVKY